MKLAKIAAWGLAAAVLPLFATESSNTFGIHCVQSRNANTLLSVTWLGTDTNAVKVAKLVKTDNLTAGDQLLVYNQGAKSYSMWVLADGVWTPATTAVLGNSGVQTSEVSDDAENASVARGSALWLIRKNPAANFYTYGACATEGTGNIKIPAGYSLQAGPIAAAYSINSGTWSNVNTNDQIIVPSFASNGASTLIVRREVDNVWKWQQVGQTTEFNSVLNRDITTKTYSDPANLPAGSGFWYKSADSETRPTVSWPAN